MVSVNYNEARLPFVVGRAACIVHLPAPETHYAKDITFNLDTPIFATGKGPFVFSRSGIVDERETDMMAVRWNVYLLSTRKLLRRSKKICYLVEDEGYWQ